MTEIVFTRIVNSSKRFVSSKNDGEEILKKNIAACESNLNRNQSFLALVIKSLGFEVKEEREACHRFGRDKLGSPVIKLSKLLSWANKNNINSDQIIIDNNDIIIRDSQYATNLHTQRKNEEKRHFESVISQIELELSVLKEHLKTMQQSYSDDLADCPKYIAQCGRNIEKILRGQVIDARCYAHNNTVIVVLDEPRDAIFIPDFKVKIEVLILSAKRNKQEVAHE